MNYILCLINLSLLYEWMVYVIVLWNQIYICHELNYVNKFKYQSSTLTNKNKRDAELNIEKVNDSYPKSGLKKNISMKTKCTIYRAIVLSTLV